MAFDTNVIVAGIVVEGLCREILEIHVPDHTAILSPRQFVARQAPPGRDQQVWTGAVSGSVTSNDA